MRLVLDCLPFEDPGNEARRIVRAGMAEIIDQLDDEHLGPAMASDVAWGDRWGSPIPMVDVLFDAERGITFCSKAFDENAKRWEAMMRALRAEFHFSREHFAIPHRVWSGVSET